MTKKLHYSIPGIPGVPKRFSPFYILKSDPHLCDVFIDLHVPRVVFSPGRNLRDGLCAMEQYFKVHQFANTPTQVRKPLLRGVVSCPCIISCVGKTKQKYDQVL